MKRLLAMLGIDNMLARESELNAMSDDMTCTEAHYVPYEVSRRIGRGRALFFAPHPDDEVLGCCGAILQHVEDGDPVRVVVVTDGGFGRQKDAASYIARRQLESVAAAKLLGYEEIHFWGFPDRGLKADSVLIQKISDEIDEMGADLVYAPSWWEVHPDHSIVAEAVTCAVKGRSLQVRLVLYEVGVPLQPNMLLDITRFLDLKKNALAQFKSQLENQAYDRQILALNEYRSYTLPSSVLAAEAYRVVSSLDMEEVPQCPLTMMLAR